MKNQNRLLLLLLTLLLINISCKKTNTDSVQSPPASKNTFSCKINGIPWGPYWRCAELATAGMAELNSTIKSADANHALPLYINVQMGNSKLGRTTFLLQDLLPSGKYIYHTGNMIDSLGITFFTDSMGYINYLLPDRHSPRYFNIETLDTVNHIVSGSFAFTFYGNRPSDNALDSLTVTEGQFDFQIGEYSKCSN